MKPQKKYIGMALDPIHVGTGGYRLGRVDNTIVRDKATNVPIIPGSSIEGTTRTYAAFALMENGGSIKGRQGINNEYLNCAGKDTDKREQCGVCEICIIFGFSKKDKSLHGMAQFSDAKILFFPVYSMLGPVWVTCPDILGDFGLTDGLSDENVIKTTFDVPNNRLNLGWLYLEKKNRFTIPDGTLKEIPQQIKNKLVLVSDKLFSQIVNSNLEVRTSVSIDPQTGAAQEGALFTYEAIPRSTILYFDIIYNDPNKFPAIPNNLRSISMDSIVENGLKLMKLLGIGGMGTRGFGRIEIYLSGSTSGGG
ncbi:MAG: type III-B CRISPR module RAMP protein Cmr4 [Candidatus Methanoperedens sp.]|nr:type III-B CRISPR module RAMP protein Cmr4 [Candidatus Methanoperedens sp.]